MPSSSSENPKGTERPARRWTKRRIFLAGFALLIVAAVACLWFSREPTQDGKPISYWISQLGTGNSGSDAALDKLGPETTIPYLLRAIDGKGLEGSGWQRFYNRHYGKIPWLLRKRLPQPQAVPALGHIEYVRSRAAYYLLRLANKHPTSASKALPRLVLLLESTNRMTRHCAAVALSGFGSNAAPAIPVIEKLLRNNPEKIHNATLTALEKCGPAALPTLLTLKHCLESTNGQLAIPCARTLWALDPSQADLIRPVAKKFCAAQDAGIRIDSASLLWRMDSDPAPVVPVLIGLLNEDDHPFDYHTILLLKGIGPGASEAIPALTARLNRAKRKEEFFLKAASEALAAMGGGTVSNSPASTPQ